MNTTLTTGSYQHEQLTAEEVQKVLESYKVMGWWP